MKVMNVVYYGFKCIMILGAVVVAHDLPVFQMVMAASAVFAVFCLIDIKDELREQNLRAREICKGVSESMGILDKWLEQKERELNRN